MIKFKIRYTPIGIIHSPHKKTTGIPIQPVFAREFHGRAEIFPEYTEGLADLEGFSHIILIYHFHEAGQSKLRVKPFLEDKSHGVFSTRAPVRPNPIGLSVVRLIEIKDNILVFSGCDILDQTPLIDIKPFIPDFDAYEKTKTGWYENRQKDRGTIISDDRFE